jgi:hypothetical protein
MVFAEQPLTALQEVLIQISSLLVLAQGYQVNSQVITGGEGREVIDAVQPPLAREDLLVQFSGLRVAPEFPQRPGQRLRCVHGLPCVGSQAVAPLLA